MSITTNLQNILNNCPKTVRLVAVSKYHSVDDIRQAYDAGQRIFGESKAQELIKKHEELPIQDIEWHFIGHLQSNKIKYIAPFISLIHSVDSLRLLRNINKEAEKQNRVISCLLQLHIADEETKYGFTKEECLNVFKSDELAELEHIEIAGLMGMATNTDSEEHIRSEFQSLKEFFDLCKRDFFQDNDTFKELSMGMSDDYPIAIEYGSTLIRVGSKIFGDRIY